MNEIKTEMQYCKIKTIFFFSVFIHFHNNTNVKLLQQMVVNFCRYYRHTVSGLTKN